MHRFSDVSVVPNWILNLVCRRESSPAINILLWTVNPLLLAAIKKQKSYKNDKKITPLMQAIWKLCRRWLSLFRYIDKMAAVENKKVCIDPYSEFWPFWVHHSVPFSVEQNHTIFTFQASAKCYTADDVLQIKRSTDWCGLIGYRWLTDEGSCLLAVCY